MRKGETGERVVTVTRGATEEPGVPGEGERSTGIATPDEGAGAPMIGEIGEEIEGARGVREVVVVTKDPLKIFFCMGYIITWRDILQNVEVISLNCPPNS